MKRPKRANGKGSVEVLPDGRARVRIVTDGKRGQLGPIYPSRERAEAVLAAYNEDAANGAIESPRGVVFGRYGEEWLDRRELSRRVRGIEQERNAWNAHVKRAPFYAEPLAEISRGEVAAWVDGLLETRALRVTRTPDGSKTTQTDRVLSRGTVAKILRLVHGVFAKAVEDELVPVSPIAGLTITRHPRDDEDVSDAWTFLELDEVARVLACPAVPAERRHLVAIAIHTGVRRGELFALRWADVHEDSDRPRIVVRRGHMGPTKSGKPRIVPLLAPAVAAFRALRKAAGRAELVFGTAEGRMYGKGYDAGWRDKRERRGKGGELRVKAGIKTLAGIDRDVRFHDLRHTCASHLVMGSWGRRWSLEEVCAFLGHSTIKVTERYAHLAPHALQAAAAATPANGPLPSVAHGATGTEAAIGLDPRDGRGRDRTDGQRRVNPAAAPVVSRTSEASGQRMGNASAEVLRLAAAGDELPPALVAELVAAVLERDEVRLALAIRHGGPLTARRAIELAMLLGTGGTEERAQLR